MGRRILAVCGAFLVLLLVSVPAYAATPTVDSAYLCSGPWQDVKFTEFQADGVSGYYKIYADTDNHCLYFAVSMYDQQVEPGADSNAVAFHLQLFSTAFAPKKFTFVNGANSAAQTYTGFGSGCNIRVGISPNSGGFWTADGNGYFAVAIDKSLCGPLTVRLDYNCGKRGVCLLDGAAFDYTLPEKTTASGSARTATARQARQITTQKSQKATTKKANVSTTKFAYTGTVPRTTKSARKNSGQTVTKFAYSGSTTAAGEEAKQQLQAQQQVQGNSTAAVTDGTYTAGVTPTHRSTMANIMIYLAVALATAAVIALVAGIIKSRKAKQEEAQEKQRQQEEQEIEEYDE